MNRSLLIQNVHLIDPLTHWDSEGDLLVQQGQIAAVGKSLSATDSDLQLIDGEGLCLSPGLVDMHVHFRDPGQTHKETLATGAAAAAAGGFTTVLCMPNTQPPCDNPAVLRDILTRAVGLPTRVLQTACLTSGMAGEQCCSYAQLKEAGATALTDDGRPVADTALMKQAMLGAQQAGLPVVSHCEDLAIVAGGIMHKGEISRRLGVPGIARASEDSITQRECMLAETTGAPVHICHVSTKGSLEIIRAAKAAGAPVTCETAAHYLLLTHEELLGRDANFRMNPPLREEEDRQALLQGVADGTIDAIITDHAPHTAAEKADFDRAPNGVVGLETSLAGCITALVAPGVITLSRLMELMSAAPARILGLEPVTFVLGAVADLVLYDPREQWQVSSQQFASKARNTPFEGRTLQGRVKYTVLGGKIVYQNI